METGMVIPFAGASAPSGYLLCDGGSYLRSSYSALFSVIGTVFGAADGTHFNVPDMRGRVPVGVGAGLGGGIAGNGVLPSRDGNYTNPEDYEEGVALPALALGDWFGSAHHIQFYTELAPHTHVIIDPGHTHPADVAPHNHTQNPHEHTAIQGTGGSTIQQQTGGSNNGYVFNPAGTNNGTTTMNTNDATATNQAADVYVSIPGAVTDITLDEMDPAYPMELRNPGVALNYVIKT